MNRALFSSSLWLAAGLAACTFGDAEPTAPAPEQDAGSPVADAASEPPPAEAQAEAGGVPELSGLWAQLWVTSSFDTLPAIGQVVGTTLSINLVKLQQQGTSVSMHVDVCGVEVDSGTPAVKEVLTDAFVKALGPLQRTAELVAGENGWELRQPKHFELHGVKLSDAQNELLPVQADDPRVVDEDGDGKPGLTIRIAGLVDGEIYVVVRDIHETRAQVVSDKELKGLIDWTKDQNVLGSDNPILADNPTKSVPNSDASASYVRMLKVDSESNCVWLVSNHKALFGR